MQAIGSVEILRSQIDPWAPQPSIRRQCQLLGISRSAYYYEPSPESPANLALMRRLDQLHLEHPVYGSRRWLALLLREGHRINRKRVMRLLWLLREQ